MNWHGHTKPVQTCQARCYPAQLPKLPTGETPLGPAQRPTSSPPHRSRWHPYSIERLQMNILCRTPMNIHSEMCCNTFEQLYIYAWNINMLHVTCSNIQIQNQKLEKSLQSQIRICLAIIGFCRLLAKASATPQAFDRVAHVSNEGHCIHSLLTNLI